MKTNKKTSPEIPNNVDSLNASNYLEVELNRLRPPAPRALSQLPAGMLGYEERKAQERAQAFKDREATSQAEAPEQKRQAFINAIKRAFPQVDVHWIAAQIKPWDPSVFKRQVSEAQMRFLKG